MTNEQKHEIAKLFRGIPGYELTECPVDLGTQRGMRWEETLPSGTLLVTLKLSGTEADYDPICWLIPLSAIDPRDAKIRALEAELAAYKAKEPLYDPNDVRFEPRGPELADCEDDGA